MACPDHSTQNSSLDWSVLDTAQLKRIQGILEATIKLRRLYEAGVPFYTKDLIRVIEAKLQTVDLTKPGELKIEWTAVDGSKAFILYDVESELELKGL
jgi:hypothetical protein